MALGDSMWSSPWEYVLAALVIAVLGGMVAVARLYATPGQFVGLLLMWGLPMTLFSACEIAQRTCIEVDGTIIESTTKCVQPENNRCATTYRIQSADQVVTYIAGPTDHSLRRRLPVGTAIRKKHWALTYVIDGADTDDFPIVPYAAQLLLGLAMMSVGIRRAPTAYNAWLRRYAGPVPAAEATGRPEPR